MLRTHENSDVFNSLDEIYLVFTSKKQISSIYFITCHIINSYFLLKKCENPLQCKGFSHFFNKNNSVGLSVTLADICLTNLCLNDIVKLTMLLTTGSRTIKSISVQNLSIKLKTLWCDVILAFLAYLGREYASVEIFEN